jgi:tetrahydromethanopterin:alpha-L-glutamate ligase
VSFAPRVAILTDVPGWHGRRLARALAALGVDATFASLSDCRVDLEANRWGLVVPGFEAQLPDGVFVREIAKGSFEQVTLRLGLLHALAEWRVPVCNSARAIERTVDKSMTSMLLRKAGIATPSTWATERESQARATLIREIACGHRLVLKPLFGSQGKGLRLLGPGDDLPRGAEYDDVYYLQRFVESRSGDACDYRVFVIAGRAVAAMLRRGISWVHNVAQGASCEATALDPELATLAERAVDAIGMDYAGVDLMRDRDGVPVVIEVNGIPAWRGLQSVTRFDIANGLAQNLVHRMRGEPTGTFESVDRKLEDVAAGFKIPPAQALRADSEDNEPARCGGHPRIDPVLPPARA